MSPVFAQDPARRCNAKTLVYSRIVGYFEPTEQWNPGKLAEFKNRVTYRNIPGTIIKMNSNSSGPESAPTRKE